MPTVAVKVRSMHRGVWFGQEVLRHGLLDALRTLNERHGTEAMDLIPVSLFGRPTYLATHPRHIGEVLNDTDNFKRAEMFLKKMEAILGFNAVTVPADEWLTVRKRTLRFLSGQALASYYTLMAEVLEESTVPRWHAQSAAGQPIDIFESMLEYSSKVVFSAFLGVPAAEVPDHLHGALSEMFDLVRKRVLSFANWPLWLPNADNRRFCALRDQVYAYLEANMDACRGNDSMLDHLIEAHTVDGTLDRTRLLEEMLGNLIGGSETTIILLIWTLHYLAHDPDLQDRVHAELDVDPSLPGKPNRHSLVSRCLTEALRIRSPSYLAAREAINPVRVGDVELPAGTHILASQFITQNDPRVWPDPDRFDPDRFATCPPRMGKDYANFFPFGGGRNICSGQAYAYQEADLAVRGLLRHFHLRPASPMDVGLAADLTLRPKIPVQVYAEPREHRATAS